MDFKRKIATLQERHDKIKAEIDNNLGIKGDDSQAMKAEIMVALQKDLELIKESYENHKKLTHELNKLLGVDKSKAWFMENVVLHETKLTNRDTPDDGYEIPFKFGKEVVFCTNHLDEHEEFSYELNWEIKKD